MTSEKAGMRRRTPRRPTHGLIALAVLFIGALSGGDAVDRASGATAEAGKIVFSRQLGGYYGEIFTVNSAGGDPTNLTGNTLMNEQSPAWSPDGSRIAFVRDLAIHVMNADGTNVTALTTGGDGSRSPTWSPDGARIAAIRSAADGWSIVVMNADGTGLTQLALWPAGYGVGSLDWSPDGARLAFSRDAGVGTPTDIWVMNADGSEQVQLTDGVDFGDHNREPDWSPDGSRIVFLGQSEAQGYDNGEIWVMNADGTGKTRLTSNTFTDGDPSWSPDGERIVFWRNVPINGNNDVGLYVMNADGSDQDRITTGLDWDPDWQRAEAPSIAFDWTMPERYGADGDGDGLTDSFPPDANGGLEIEPEDGWRVDFDADQEGEPCDTTLERTWLLDGVEIAADDPNVVSYDPASCDFSYRFDEEGTYPISLEVKDADGNLVGFTTQDVVVQDWLVISIGDSVASGEGNPDIPIVATWQDRQCHRSALAGPARAALALEDADPRTSVTFVHLACSGATTLEGLLGPYAGQEPGALLPPQVEELERLAGEREIDAVLVSIGANDVHFSDIVVLCLEQRDCTAKAKKSAASLFQQYLAGLPSGYNLLAFDLAERGVPAERVYLSEYFDPTRDDQGNYCDETMLADASLTDYFGTVKTKQLGFVITAEEAAWASNTMMPSLNAAGADAATRHGWSYVGGIRDPFLTHGYCAEEHWVVRYTESIARQGNRDGTLHPNAPGHELYGQRIASGLVADLYAGGEPRRPREPSGQ